MERDRSWAAASDGSDIQTQANVELEHHGGVTIARIRGDIDTSNVGDIELALQIGAPPNGPGMVVDLTGVDYLNSAAIKMLFGVSEQLRARGHQLRVVVDEAASIRKVLTIIHFERLVPLHRSVKEAEAQITASRGEGDALPSSGTAST
jgi:anti-anti-sigma factor